MQKCSKIQDMGNSIKKYKVITFTIHKNWYVDKVFNLIFI